MKVLMTLYAERKATLQLTTKTSQNEHIEKPFIVVHIIPRVFKRNT